jgi:hypothetical protein
VTLPPSAVLGPRPKTAAREGVLKRADTGPAKTRKAQGGGVASLPMGAGSRPVQTRSPRGLKSRSTPEA